MQNQIQRLILTLDPKTHAELLQIAIDGLNEDNGNVLTRSQRLCSQLYALDTITWLLAEWKSHLHCPDLIVPTKRVIVNFVKLFIDSLQRVLRSAYVGVETRTLSHKWTIFLCEIIQVSQNVKDLSTLARDLLIAFLSEERKILDEIFQVNAASLHWLFLIIGNVVEQCTISELSAQFPELALLANQFINSCVEILTSLGRNWAKQWTNSLHSKLARDFQLSGFVLEKSMFDYPLKVLSLKSCNITARSQSTELARHACRRSLIKQNLLNELWTTQQPPNLDWSMAPKSSWKNVASSSNSKSSTKHQLVTNTQQQQQNTAPFNDEQPEAQITYIPSSNSGGNLYSSVSDGLHTLTSNINNTLNNLQQQYYGSNLPGGIYTLAYGAPPMDSTNFFPYNSSIGYTNSTAPPPAKKSVQSIPLQHYENLQMIVPLKGAKEQGTTTYQATATICPEYKIDELSWLEMFSIDQSNSNSTSTTKSKQGEGNANINNYTIIGPNPPPGFSWNQSTYPTLVGSGNAEILDMDNYMVTADPLNDASAANAIGYATGYGNDYGAGTTTTTGTGMHNSWKVYAQNSWQTATAPDRPTTNNAATTGTLEQQLLFNQMPGLLEVEPLLFKCVYGTDHIKVVNEQTKETTDLSTAKLPPNTVTTVEEFAGQMANMDATSKLANIYSLKHQLHYQHHRFKNTPTNIPNEVVDNNNDDSIFMDILAPTEQQHAVDDVETQQSAASNVPLLAQPHTNATIHNTCDISSASTFGVPTTPKSTPFQLTPTPLSPITSSETDLNDFDALCGCDGNKRKLEDDKAKLLNTSKFTSVKSGAVSSSAKMPPRRLFQSPPQLSLSIDRMTMGAKKFVVLDFGCKVLLTDVIIPSTEYMSLLSIDAWITDETVDLVSVASTKEISTKSLLLTDIQPSLVCRFVKLTYVVNQLYSEPCTVKLGQFFGTRFISPWQINSAKLSTEQLESFDTVKLMPNFLRLLEHVGSLYEQSISALKSMLRNTVASNRVIRTQYHECFNLRLEYNTIRNLIERLERDKQLVNQKPEHKNSTTTFSSGWNMCGAEQLATIANRLFSLLNLYSFYYNERPKIVHSLKNELTIQQLTPMLTLETAVLHFGHFCMDSLTKLQMECTAWLFHNGIYTEWWDKFFSQVLSQHFVSSSAHQKNLDSAFILLSYLCNETVKYPRFQTKLIKQLVEFVLTQLNNKNEENAEIAQGTQNIQNRMHSSFSKSLLSRTLTLIASAFDVIISKKRQNDRWAFLTGDFGRNASNGSANNTHSGTTLQRGYAIKKKFGVASAFGPIGSGGTAQQKILLPAKNYYKKLSDQLEKMKQNESISQAKLDKLKSRLNHMQLLYAKFKQQEDEKHAAVPMGSSDPSSLSVQNPSAVIGNKLRQYNFSFAIRLRLPTGLCIAMVRSLLALLCEHSSDATQLQLHTQLIAFKVISKICVHGSTQPIPLSVAFEQHMKQILTLAFNDFDEPWVRHAVLSMFLDISEAEIRALSREMLAKSLGDIREGETGTAGSSKISLMPSSSTKMETQKQEEEKMDVDAVNKQILLTQGEAKRRKEDNDTIGFDKIETLFEDACIDDYLLAETLNERDDDLLMNMDETRQQDFLNTLVDSTISEATSMAAAANVPPTSSSSQLQTTQNFDYIQGKTIDDVQSHSFDSANLMGFYSNCEHLANLFNIQPIAVTIERSMESMLAEKDAIHNCRRVELFQNTLIRSSFRRLELLHPQSLESSFYSNDNERNKDEQIFTQLGHCMQATMQIIDQIFSGLNNTDNSAIVIRPCFVERLLDFYWQYQANIAAFLNSKSNSSVAKSELFRAPPLGAGAARALISYASDNLFISEIGWIRVLTTLNNSFRLKPSLIDAIVLSGKLQSFFQYFCFIGPTSRNISTNAEIGPSLDLVFEQFIHFIVAKSTSPAIINMLVDTLISIYSKKGCLSFSKFSLEAVYKISQIFAQCTDKYMFHCDLQRFVRLYAVLMRFSKEFLQASIDTESRLLNLDKNRPSNPQISMYNNYGNGQSFTTINAPARNICFSIGSTYMCDIEKSSGDPLELLGGPILQPPDQLDIQGVPISGNIKSSLSTMQASKKAASKTLKTVQQSVAMSSLDEIPQPMLQAGEEQMMSIVEPVEASGPFYSTPTPMWNFPTHPFESGLTMHSSYYWPTLPMHGIRHGKQRAAAGPSVMVIHADKNETILCNLLKTICLIIRGNQEFASLILNNQLEKKNEFLGNAIEFLALCDLNVGQTLETVSIKKWKVISLADAILYSMLTILQNLDHPKSVGTIGGGFDQSRQFMQLFIQHLQSISANNITGKQLSKHISNLIGNGNPQQTTDSISSIAFIDEQTGEQKQQTEQKMPITCQPMELSAPLAILLMQITKEPSRRKLFVQLDGHEFIATQLQQSILAFTEVANSAWPQGSSSFTEVQRQLRNIAFQISGFGRQQQQAMDDTNGNSAQASKTRTDTNLNSKYTFAGDISAGTSATTLTNQPQTYAAAVGFQNAGFSNTGGTAKKQISAKLGATNSGIIQQQQQLTKPQIYNYAPNCVISSSSTMTNHLQLLITASAPHRRSRNPNWSYHFPAHQQWLDITLTLPHPILLNEVVIKPHTSSLLSAPSAVQIELCSDPMGIAWSPIQYPMSTLGCSRISIPTTTYKSPVTAVRLYLKKPVETNSLGLMQIQVNGSTQLAELQQQHTPVQQLLALYRWLTLFHQIVILSPKVDKMPVSSYAPKLITQLVQLFLGNPAYPSDDVLQLIYRVLLDIDRELPMASDAVPTPKSIVQQIIEQILQESGVHTDRINIQLAELLTSCTTYNNNNQNKNIPFRVRELLNGILELIDQLVTRKDREEKSAEVNTTQLMINLDQDWAQRDAKWASLSLLMWSAACSLWKNSDPNLMEHVETATLCNKIAHRIIEPLAQLSLLDDEDFASLSHSPLAEHVLKSSRWLLCSFIRSAPEHLEQLLMFYGFQNDPISNNLKAFEAISQVCQSRPAIEKLKENFHLEYWIQKAVQICEYDKNKTDLDQLIAILECIESLTAMSDVCQLLDQSDDGPAFFRRLMNFLVNYEQQIGAMATKEQIGRLRSSFINLVRRCLTSGGNHRARIAKYLCELLRSGSHQLDADYMPTGALNDYLLQMLHRFVLDDEVIKVHFTNIIQLGNRQDVLIPVHESSKRIVHPIFGCNSEDCIFEISLYTKCSELLPYGAGNKTTGKNARPPLISTKFSAADQWIKSNFGFVPPQSNPTVANSMENKDWDMDDYLDEWPSLGEINQSLSAWSASPPPSTASLTMPKFAKKIIYSKALEKIAAAHDIAEHKRAIHLINSRTNVELHGNQVLANLLQELGTESDADKTENDGYMILCMTMSYQNGVPCKIPMDPRQSVEKCIKIDGQQSMMVSTLEHFADVGGLHALSKYIYLYQQSLSRLLNCCENLSAELTARQQKMHNVINQTVATTTGTGTTVTGPGNAPPPGMIDDFEFIDDFPSMPISITGVIPPPGSIPIFETEAIPVNSTVMLSSIPMELIDSDFELPSNIQWQWGSGWNSEVGNNIDFMSGPGTSGFSGTGKKIRMPATDLANDQFLYNSAHVLSSLDLFLRLEHYAQLFIRMDRLKAKRLLRLALNIRVTEPSIGNRIARLRPRPVASDPIIRTSSSDRVQQFHPPHYNPNTGCAIPSSASGIFPPPPYIYNRQQFKSTDSTVDSAHEELLLFPFVVLAHLFNNFNPTAVGMDSALSIRQQALRLGIIDVLLVGLEHFAHLPSRCKPLRVNAHKEPMVHLIRHVLNAVSNLEQLRQTCNTVQQNMDMQLMNYGGNIGGGATESSGALMAFSNGLSTTTTAPTQSSSITTGGDGSNSSTTAAATTITTEGSINSQNKADTDNGVGGELGSGVVGSSSLSTAASTIPSVPSSMISRTATNESSGGEGDAVMLTETVPIVTDDNAGAISGAGTTTGNANAINASTAFPTDITETTIQQPLTTAAASIAGGTLNTDGNYWAKGTGFGSGTTQQQWNLNQHVAKKRQDENYVASLLNILISFISPSQFVIDQSSEHVPTNSNTEQEDSSSTIGMDLMLPIFANPLEPSENATKRLETPEENTTSTAQEQQISEQQQQIQLTEEFLELLYRSCVATTVKSHLMNDSVLDISKRVHIFESVVSLVLALSKSPPIPVANPHNFSIAVPENELNQHQEQLTMDILDILFIKNLTTAAERKQAEGELLGQLNKLAKNIEVYLNKLHTGHRSQTMQQQQQQAQSSSTTTTTTTQSKKRQKHSERKAWRQPIASKEELEEEEELGRLLEIVHAACQVITKKMEKQAAEEQERMDSEEQQQHADIFGPSLRAAAPENAAQIYCEQLKEHQFETIQFYDSNGNNLQIPYHYSSSLTTVGQSAGMNKRTRRLAQEIVSLSSSLPLTASSSVFVRTSEERLDAMKVLITGPADTPYSNGCFEFDVFFPSDYPNSPMQMNLETTGNRTVRFNPNLYDDGKVCLSILNTWRGRPEERWNADTSSLLQVLVSIQSLILVHEPYFNEPGYERWRNTPAGQQASREYDANIRQMCIRWAMIEQIRNPPRAFDEVIKRHFWLKRDEICDQVESWIEDIEHYVTSKVNTSKTLPSYLAGIKKQYETLKVEFSKMHPPPGLEGCHQSSRYPCTAGVPSGDNQMPSSEQLPSDSKNKALDDDCQ